MPDVFVVVNGEAMLQQSVPRLAKPEEVVWVDLHDSRDKVADILSKIYICHPLILEHIERMADRPRISTYDVWSYLVFSAVSNSDKAAGMGFIHVVFNTNTIITVHDGSVLAIEELKKRLQTNGGATLLSQGAGFFVYTLLDEVTDCRLSYLDCLQDEIDELEDRIMLAPDYYLHESILEMRRKLQRERRLASAERDVVNNMLRPEFPHLGRELERYMLDLYYHVSRVLEITDAQREHLMALAEMLMSATAQRTNDIMKLLTVVSTIFMPLTLITGIYGMNFVYMPELNWRWGYLMVVGAMGVITVVMLKLFRRKNWL